MVAFQRASGSTGTSHTIDIGAASNDRLLVAILNDESNPGATFQGTVSVDGNNFSQGLVAQNTDGIGSHQEMHWISEGALGSSNGSQSVSFSGGDTGWAIHVLVFYGVLDAAPGDTDIDDLSIAPANITVDIDVPLDGVAVMGGANGSGGTIDMAFTSPMIESTQGPNPSSAVLATGYAIETAAQTNKNYQGDPTATSLRNSGTIASWSNALTTVEVTHTTDAIKQEQDISRTHTTDAIKQATVEQTHTANALIVDRQAVVHTTDAVVTDVIERVHTADAINLSVTDPLEQGFEPLVDPQIDTGHVLRVGVGFPDDSGSDQAVAYMQLRQGASVIQEFNVVLNEGDEQVEVNNITSINAANITDYADLRFYGWFDSTTRTLDTVDLEPYFYFLEMEVPGFSGQSHTTDAVIVPSFIEQTHTTDARLILRSTLIHTTDAILQAQDISLIHTTDAIKLEEIERTHTSDAIKQATVETTHSTDAIKQATVATTHTADAHIVARLTVGHTTDGRMVDRQTEVHTADARLVIRQTDSHTTDAITQATEPLTHTADAIMLVAGMVMHTTDAIKKETIVRIHTTDAIVQQQDIVVVHTSDAIVVDRQTETHTTDAILQATSTLVHTTDVRVVDRQVLTHTTNAIKLDNFTPSHTTDAIKLSSPFATHTTHAIKKAEGTTVPHTTDAIVQTNVTQTHTTDAILKETIAATHITDALVLEKQEATHTTDAIKTVNLSQSHSSDAELAEFQYSYPSATIAGGDWESAPTPAQPLHEQVDELGQPSDTDYIWDEV